jgi:hypothetical protein
MPLASKRRHSVEPVHTVERELALKSPKCCEKLHRASFGPVTKSVARQIVPLATSKEGLNEFLAEIATVSARSVASFLWLYALLNVGFQYAEN